MTEILAEVSQDTKINPPAHLRILEIFEGHQRSQPFLNTTWIARSK